ncbi:hypothetical protein P7C70_g872, partial [Phenoliferia sp. Uapishka_3]
MVRHSQRQDLGRLLLAALYIAIFVPVAAGQSCLNYGSLSSTSTCECPSGLSGPTCDQVACGNPLLSQSQRPILDDSLAGNSGAGGCGNQCTPGFTGPTCNTCTLPSACSSAALASASTSASTTSAGLVAPGGLGGGSGASDVTCSTSPWAWTESFTSCAVVNPTLQSVFPGTTALTYSKTVDPALALSTNPGGNGTIAAQLWYSSSKDNSSIIEQFYCKADSCVQSNSTSKVVDWSCQNLAPGAFFCGGGGALDLTETIDTLSGYLIISCDVTGGTCAFKQEVLQKLFGANGLALSSCISGECVKQSTIAALASVLHSSTSDGSTLSNGVIAGLVVLGAIVLALLILIGFGWNNQRKARTSTTSSTFDEKPLASSGVGLRWSEIGYSLPSRGLRIAKRKSGGEDGRVLLDGITGEVAPGHLLAILGPTGAGKSTFVDILAGRRKSGRSSGSVELILSKDEPGRIIKIGYVDQHDILPSTSTVRETLMFAASLKLPESWPRERVFDVLSQLGLLDCADTRIGGSERRGISGGERRRVSIGLELLSAPAILILDEPTSGLDSVSAKRVISVLKSLTTSESNKTTIITTIHQPNSQVYHLFDSVLVLTGGGRQLHLGPAADVNSTLAARGHHCPEGWNPADYLLELASDPPVDLLSPTTLRASKISSQAWQKSYASEDANSDEGKDNQQMLPALHKFPPSGKATTQASQKPATVILTQFQVLAGRQFHNLQRDWSLVVRSFFSHSVVLGRLFCEQIMHNLVAAIVGVFVGGMFFQVNSSIGGFQSRIGSLFFLGSLLAFASLSALTNFIHVKPLFLRERSNGLYSPVSFFLSEVVFDIVPLRIAPTLIASCIVYWMVGLSPSASHFFKFLLILLEFNVAATLFNLCLAASLSQASIAILISAVLNLFQMAFAGFFVNIASIPPVLRWLQWIAPLKYTLEALAVNEVSSGLMIVDTLQGVKINVSAELIMDVLFGFKSNAYYRNVLVLFGFVGGFALILVGTVVYRLREMR